MIHHLCMSVCTCSSYVSTLITSAAMALGATDIKLWSEVGLASKIGWSITLQNSLSPVSNIQIGNSPSVLSQELPSFLGYYICSSFNKQRIHTAFNKQNHGRYLGQDLFQARGLFYITWKLWHQRYMCFAAGHEKGINFFTCQGHCRRLTITEKSWSSTKKVGKQGIWIRCIMMQYRWYFTCVNEWSHCFNQFKM